MAELKICNFAAVSYKRSVDLETKLSSYQDRKTNLFIYFLEEITARLFSF